MNVTALSEDSDIGSELSRLDGTWPRFYDGCGMPHSALNRVFPEYQLVLADDDGRVVAAARSFPLRWDGSVDGLPAGLEEALTRSVERPPRGSVTVCAYSIVVDPDRRGEGWSSAAIQAMRAAAGRRGETALVAPVRPSWKSRYPITPIDVYLAWRGESGLAFDPWVRTQQRLGGRILRIAPRSLVCRGTVAEWEEWTGMRFPQTGRYVVPDALEPVMIDVEGDLGVFEEPNVWIRHDVRAGAATP